MLTQAERDALPTERWARTNALLRRALPNATFDGLYVRADGKRCLVGEVLALLGVPDADLRGDRPSKNSAPLFARPDLDAMARNLGLATEYLRAVQDKADALARLLGADGRA